jgi:FkbM family methyltransferase
MRPGPFVSYAQNAEDVVLRRALGHVERGHYVDVGANLPWQDSTTAGFYEQGWRGLLVEPVAEFADRLRAERPEDDVEETLIGDGSPVTFHEIAGTGLSTTIADVAAQHRAEGREVLERTVPTVPLQQLVDARPHLRELTHVLSVDVEGAEAAILASADLRAWRPWVVVVEATRPNTSEPTHEAWEPDLLAAGYRFCLFDGLSRFYVADEHADLAPALSYPGCVLDRFVRYDVDRLLREHERDTRLLAELQEDLHTWRVRAAAAFDDATAAVLAQVDAGEGPLAPRLNHAEFMAEHYRSELEALRRTLSWRVTAPLRRAAPLLRRGTTEEAR